MNQIITSINPCTIFIQDDSGGILFGNKEGSGSVTITISEDSIVLYSKGFVPQLMDSNVVSEG